MSFSLKQSFISQGEFRKRDVTSYHRHLRKGPQETPSRLEYAIRYPRILVGRIGITLSKQVHRSVLNLQVALPFDQVSCATCNYTSTVTDYSNRGP